MPTPISPKAWCFTKTLRNDTYPDIDPASPDSQSDCTGKAVLVTGANKGLGRAFVIAYARAGASHIAIGSRGDASDVVMAVLDAAKQAGRAAPAVYQIKIDVCDQATIDAAADWVRKEFGRLDILVNNAGYMGPSAPLLEQPLHDYLQTLDVNLAGTYRVTKALLPLMLEGGDKTVVVLTSVGAHGVEGATGAYSIAKFGLCRFTQFLVEEYGEQGVLSYAYHPGGVMTDLATNLPEHIKVRLADTAELASHTLVFLTSKKRTWLGGRYLSANWDMPQLMDMEEDIVRGNLLKFVCTFGEDV